MLSRASRLVLSRAFCSSIQSSGSAAPKTLAEQVEQVPESVVNANQLATIEKRYKEEEVHLAYYVNRYIL